MNSLKPWHLLVLAVVFLILFGSKRLPDSARSLGRSLRIFKSEVQEMNNDATLKEKREAWHQALSKDVYVEEALNVLDDLQGKPIVKKPMNAKLKDGKLVKS